MAISALPCGDGLCQFHPPLPRPSVAGAAACARAVGGAAAAGTGTAAASDTTMAAAPRHAAAPRVLTPARWILTDQLRVYWKALNESYVYGAVPFVPALLASRTQTENRYEPGVAVPVCQVYVLPDE